MTSTTGGNDHIRRPSTTGDPLPHTCRAGTDSGTCHICGRDMRPNSPPVATPMAAGEPGPCPFCAGREDVVEATVETLRECEAALEFAVSTIASRAPEADWPGSSPRKGLAAVRALLARLD